MATASRLDYPHIERNPGVRAGKACIAGTRIAVVDVALAEQEGLSPEQIRGHFTSRALTLAEVHAALAYHYDHPEELQEYLRRGGELEGEIEAINARHAKPGRD